MCDFIIKKNVIFFHFIFFQIMTTLPPIFLQATTHPSVPSPARARFLPSGDNKSSSGVVLRKRVSHHHHDSHAKRSSEPGSLLKVALDQHFKDPNLGVQELDLYLLQVSLSHVF